MFRKQACNLLQYILEENILDQYFATHLIFVYVNKKEFINC